MSRMPFKSGRTNSGSYAFLRLLVLAVVAQHHVYRFGAVFYASVGARLGSLGWEGQCMQNDLDSYVSLCFVLLRGMIKMHPDRKT